jgi:hypothetical protein
MSSPPALSRQTLNSLDLVLHWHSSGVRHRDVTRLEKTNLWRDIVPAGLDQSLEGRYPGESVCVPYDAAMLAYFSDPVQYRTRFAHIRPDRIGTSDQRLTLRTGRFYPRHVLERLVEDIYEHDFRPFRFSRLEGDTLSGDFRHPMADHSGMLEIRIVDVRFKGQEHGGRLSDYLEEAASLGPGMQASTPEQPVDYWSDSPFARLAPEADSQFYDTPRMVPHLDSQARQVMTDLYALLLQPGDRVLDLMSSWQSHLPAVHFDSVCGLGMNREELDANPQLTHRIVHDLNATTEIPLDDASFDAVVCSLSVEYLTSPQSVLNEVARVLRPGGHCIITFSNRWFEPKVIRVWRELHPFERMGFVTELMRQSGHFEALETFSMRGLSRPPDDRYWPQQPQSDPVFAVHGQKTVPR